MSLIRNELSIRKIKKINYLENNAIVGAEIKNRRISKSQTLEALADRVCSTSYLCKIEKNKIEPNKAFLREICSRSELSDEKVDYLFELGEILNRVVKAYNMKDYSYIEYAFEGGMGFKNYRYNIIKMIYYITQKDITNALIVQKELISICSNMSDCDLSTFAVFSAILAEMRYDFKEALDNVELVDESCLSLDLSILKNIVEFEAHFAQNLHDTPIYYEKAKKVLFETEYYKIVAKLNYLISLYYIKNNCEHSYEMVQGRINDRKMINSLSAIKAFYDNNISILVNYDDNELNAFALTLKKICTDTEKALELLKVYNKDYYSCEYDGLFLEYLVCGNSTDKYNYIFEKGLPIASKANDMFLCNYFLFELSKMPRSAKNRSLTRAYALIYGNSFRIGDFELMKYEEN